MAPSEQTLRGKTVLITGATRGIGFETAKGLAARSARVLMVGRDAARTRAQAQAIRTATGNEQIETLVADLTSLAEIRRLADEVLVRVPRLDVLFNNAGAAFATRKVTVDGFERTFALNHLSYFLLTTLLLDRLKASSPARIINTASAAHFGAKPHFDDLQHEHGYSQFGVYSETKFYNVLFTYELARRLAGTDITANCLHPGFVASGFGKNDAWYMKLAMSIVRPAQITAAKGAETSIYLASSPDVDNVTGKYFDKCKAVESSKASYDEAAARRLWEISEQLTGLVARV